MPAPVTVAIDVPHPREQVFDFLDVMANHEAFNDHLMTDWRLEGPYMKNCNCDPGCPCDFNAAPTHHHCEGMAAMIVERGHFGDVNLDGARWAFKFHDPVIAEIDIDIDVDGRRAHCRIGDTLETTSEPLQSIGEDVHDYAIQVRIPGGFEYDEAEIAMAKVLKGSGPIAFDLAGTHSSLAHVSRHPDN